MNKLWPSLSIAAVLTASSTLVSDKLREIIEDIKDRVTAVISEQTAEDKRHRNLEIGLVSFLILCF